ncbi:MAG: hypothetical protein AAFQ96_07035 [Pseudomonadota bacterium]
MAKAAQRAYMAVMSSDSAATATDADRIEAASGSLSKSVQFILRLLARPALKRWRPIMVIALLLTLASKALSVAGPVALGEGINALTGTAAAGAALGFIALFTLLRFLSSALPQLRDVLFAPVSQDAQRLAALSTRFTRSPATMARSAGASARDNAA